MPQSGLQRIVETGTFSWPWQTGRGLAILTGGSGGGGGGGGAFCIEGLNLYGGGGGGGGQATTLTVGSRVFRASGGDDGSGGNGGGMVNGKPLKGDNGRGSRIDGGGAGGKEQPCKKALAGSYPLAVAGGGSMEALLLVREYVDAAARR